MSAACSYGTPRHGVNFASSYFRIAFIALLLVQLFPLTVAAAQDLHGDICLTAVKVMLEPPGFSSPRLKQLEDLRATLPQLDNKLQPPMQRLIRSMDKLLATLHGQSPLSPQDHDEFNIALLDMLTLVKPGSSAYETPLTDLPERLDFALVLYVSWAEIGSLRPAREQSDSYLGLDIPYLAESIERDLLRDDWVSLNDEHQRRILEDAQARWRYIAKLLLKVNTDPAPLSVAKQIGKIRSNLLLLRRSSEA
ncbi:hypothetical protein ACFPU0_07845 [Pseudomonas sp. GCM10022186]|uniref:hypothetical protein n=1 Tax=Pseudomonas sp. GCM10022186 TaxID=3252650 RepID=UPI0036235533